MAKIKTEWDGTPEGMEKLKAEHQGLLVVGVQNHRDGNFLVFAAPEDLVEPPPAEPPPPTLEQKVAALEARIAALEAQVQTKKI